MHALRTQTNPQSPCHICIYVHTYKRCGDAHMQRGSALGPPCLRFRESEVNFDPRAFRERPSVSGIVWLLQDLGGFHGDGVLPSVISRGWSGRDRGEGFVALALLTSILAFRDSGVAEGFATSGPVRQLPGRNCRERDATATHLSIRLTSCCSRKHEPFEEEHLRATAGSIKHFSMDTRSTGHPSLPPSFSL